VGFPPLSRLSPATSLPPFALGLASTHLGWGTRRHSLVGLGTPQSRNADMIILLLLLFIIIMVWYLLTLNNC
jgi:hypothetical protein